MVTLKKSSDTIPENNQQFWMKCIRKVQLVLSGLVLATLLSVMAHTAAYADVVGYDGGIMGNPLIKAGTYEYQEITFVSGEPILLTGTVTIPAAPAATLKKYTTTYTFDLANTAKTTTLSRKVSCSVELTKDEAMNQTTYKTTPTKLDETYTVGTAVYTLARYNYNQSLLVDNTPAVDYFSGNLYVERAFYKNGTALKNDGVLTIISKADTIVGYKHKWGKSETQVINQRYDFVPPVTTGTTTATRWSGTATVKMSSINKKAFEYRGNNQQSISFKGSYVMNENQENVLKYNYDMPQMAAGTITEAVRAKNTVSLKKNVVVGSTSLVAPKIRDIGGHWAEKDIFLMTSLKVFDEYDRTGAVPRTFSPNTPITRLDFAKAVARAIGDVKPLTTEDIIKRDRPGAVKTVTYQDIDSKNPDISYIEFLDSKHMMIGEGQYFYPDKPITRAEATTIMISALGLTDIAPQAPYRTVFKDDKSLPIWAKDYIYAANEIGLVTPYKDGMFKPAVVVTRAEAANLVAKMVNHIRESITTDYREKILNR